MDQRQAYDVVIVGGGAAGLSAALVLGRARRRVLVVDAGGQSNLAAHGIGGLLGHDGRPPAEFYAAGRRELAAYPSVTVRDGRVVEGVRAGARFVLTLDDGTDAAADRVLLATGMDYRYADVAGLRERWGDGVFHCPFCHGWEVRDRPLAVLDDGPHGAMRAQLLRGWSEDVTLLTNGAPPPAGDDAARLDAAGIAVDVRPLDRVEGAGTRSEAVVFADGGTRAVGGLLVAVTLHQRDGLAAALGATFADRSPMSTDAVAVDAQLRTGVPGLFAAGDATVAMPSVTTASTAGSTAAAMIVHDIALGAPAVAAVR